MSHLDGYYYLYHRIKLSELTANKSLRNMPGHNEGSINVLAIPITIIVTIIESGQLEDH